MDLISKLNISYLKSTDPFTNLATENTILENLDLDTIHILLYVNRPSIVMGRFQNPFLECHFDKMLEDDVLLVRRQSGGGCVYHDLGNLNYSVVAPKSVHSKDINHSIIIDALKTFGVTAISTKRVDLFVDDVDGVSKKISGSAFKEKRESAFHHGTLLINTNLDKLNTYLVPKSKSIQSVSIASVRSKVLNLSHLNRDINVESLVQEIQKSSQKFYDLVANVVDLESIELDDAYYKKLISSEWIFNETPKFEICDYLFAGTQTIDFKMVIKKFKFVSIELESSLVHPSYVELLNNELLQKNLMNDEVSLALRDCSSQYPMYAELNNSLSKWFDELVSGPRKLSSQMHRLI